MQQTLIRAQKDVRFEEIESRAARAKEEAKQRSHGCVGALARFDEPWNIKCWMQHKNSFYNIKPHFPIVWVLLSRCTGRRRTPKFIRSARLQDSRHMLPLAEARTMEGVETFTRCCKYVARIYSCSSLIRRTSPFCRCDGIRCDDPMECDERESRWT